MAKKRSVGRIIRFFKARRSALPEIETERPPRLLFEEFAQADSSVQ
jgi:hypothetical protein